MGDTDEELVRKLHLEINGLARPRRARAALEVSGECFSADAAADRLLVPLCISVLHIMPYQSLSTQLQALPCR